MAPQNLASADSKPAFTWETSFPLPVGTWQQFFTSQWERPLSYIGKSDSIVTKDFVSILPPCNNNQNACVQKIEYQLGNGDWKIAIAGPEMEQDKVVTTRGATPATSETIYSSTYKEDLGIKRPEGNTARLWDFPEAPHGGGTGYQVAAQLRGLFDDNGVFNTDAFRIQIVPMSGVERKVYDFPTNLNIKVTVKLGLFFDSLQGWFDGRLEDSTITLDKVNRNLVITGKPMVVPTTAITPIKYADIPKTYSYWNHNPEFEANQDSLGIGTGGVIDVSSGHAVKIFVEMQKHIMEKALGENTLWKVASISADGSGNCAEKGTVSGIVITNSTTYDAKAPSWDPNLGSLEFKVASSHYLSNGEVFKGYYKLLVSEKTATCYWGTNFSKGTASISITNLDGTPNIATTNLGVQDGWVNFEAAGFTFSAPTIRARIDVPKVVEKTQTSTPTPTPAPKIRAITCIAKNAKKIVRGINPKCPKGYKKK